MSAEGDESQMENEELLSAVEAAEAALLAESASQRAHQLTGAADASDEEDVDAGRDEIVTRACQAPRGVGRGNGVRVGTTCC